MKKRLLALLLALAMALGLAACGGGDAPSNPPQDENTANVDGSGGEDTPAPTPVNAGDPQHGGAATFYYPKFYNYFDPAAKNQFGYMLWMDCLFMIDWGLNDPSECDFTSSHLTYDHIAGQAAESWVVAPDYSSIEITLHDNIVFQTKEGEYNIFGGRQFTAEDAAYTIDRLLGLNGVARVECETDWTRELYMVQNVEVVDDLTFRVTFNTATENALNDFMYQCAVSVGLTGHEWDELTEAQRADWRYAIGTGAYILTEYVADNYMQFAANENYFAEDERHPGEKLPYIKDVKLVYIADSDNILSQFLAGELDWFGGQKSGLLSASQIAQLKATLSESDYTEYFYPSGSPSGIGLKCNQAPFDDINVRIAMQHAINVDEIWTSYFGQSAELVIPGLWSAEMGDWSLAGKWSAETAAEYAYDPDLARQMLADAGYPDGFEFELVCDPLADPDLYVLAQQYLSAVGIKMTITPVSEVMEHNAIVTNPDDDRQYNGFAGNFTDLMGAFGMTCTGGFGSGLFHNNSEYDGLMMQLQSATDLASAAELARQMDEIYTSQHWVITFGGAPMCSEFMSGRIGGFTGENIYNNGCMRVIFPRIWVNG